MTRKRVAGTHIAKGDFVYRHDNVPVFVEAKGSIFTDADGHRYLDAEAANGTASLGFDDSILIEAQQKVQHLPSVPSFCETEIRLKVADRIATALNQATGSVGKVSFELGGAQGIELALRVAKANRKASQFVVFESGYHGRSVYTAQFSASHRYRMAMGELRVPIVRIPFLDADTARRWPQERTKAIERLKNQLTLEGYGIVAKNSPDIVALMIEPLQNAGGIVRPDEEFLKTAVDLFRAKGALIIVDEIFCGWYRTGTKFGFERLGIRPDIVVMSKALTNGVTPLSCVWAVDPLCSSENFPPGSHSATFVNNPLALAVADTVIDRYERWTNVTKDVQALEKKLDSLVKKIVRSSKYAVSGYAVGGTARILLTGAIASPILDIARVIARENPYKNVHGLILASTGMAPNVIALNPPLTISAEEMDILEELLSRTFAEADRSL
ncbi:hypothetical protein COU18_02050 [Candidatus Kaiserbacteria bacterium CG10_big_fil_rev_8_21_14_0_10_51_14]|uniref:Aspartate aminotransferase family protein n=1 Tax=Candidatus Kaiserbacteria bacterium CG10_big_fil_rev_8_21_14_0_10_51_14 TaxID=1974610 RepID=A0A2H0UBQ9_9BACT|nr:MAG: hypothetical protein COU18_02050 [Candidatus Kaiserbacteria bacterium CG10_big_fil_rev_8_21_14_0_10_51_14]